MVNKLTILAVLLFVVFSGCVKELKVDFGEPSRKIVLYPLLTSNKPITIKMSAPASILSNKFPVLTNPLVIITVDDVPVDTVNIDSNGKGYSDIVPERSHLYGFYASADGYPPASCISQLPEPVQGFELDTFHLFDGSTRYVNFKLKLKDDPNSNDYYKISIYRKKYITSRISFYRDTSYISIMQTPVMVNNPVVDFFSIWSENLFLAREEINLTNETLYRYKIGSEEYWRGTAYYFNDILFQGKETVLNLIVAEINLSPFPEKYMIELSTLSKDYYQGLKSYAVYGTKEDLDLPIKEEVSIYSAVKGGYGFPIAYVTVCDSLFWLTQ